MAGTRQVVDVIIANLKAERERQALSLADVEERTGLRAEKEWSHQTCRTSISAKADRLCPGVVEFVCEFIEVQYVA